MKKIIFALSLLLISGTAAVSAQGGLFDSPEYQAFSELFFGDSPQEKLPSDEGKKGNEGIALFEKAQALFDQSKYTEAIPLYKSAINAWEECLNMVGYDYDTLKFNLSAVYSNTGNCYRILEHNEESLTYFEKAITYNPDNKTTYRLIGIVCRELQQYDKAEGAYRQMIRIDPGDGRSYANIGSIYYFNKEKNTENRNIALYFYEKALERDSSFQENTLSDILLLDLARQGVETLKEEGYSSARANPDALPKTTRQSDADEMRELFAMAGISYPGGSAEAEASFDWRTRLDEFMAVGSMKADGESVKGGPLTNTGDKAIILYRWADGTVYMGEYSNGNFNGPCIVIPAIGELYDGIPGWQIFQGVYENGKPKFGSGYDENGNYIDTGIFINGELYERYVNEDSADGAIKFEVIVYDRNDPKERDFYIGLTRYGKRHARGLLVWKNNVGWYGGWNDGKRAGVGIQFKSDGYYSGKWTDNESEPLE